VSDRPHPRVALHWPASRHGNLSRFRLLADVVRDHQRAALAAGAEPRPRDSALYERLAKLEQSLPLRETA
jgi:hypothetical protein